jgi:hypothetical protein
MARINRRKLKLKDVAFVVEVEPEQHAPVRGNAIASGDDAADRELEDQIIAALDSGIDEAWCTIMVKATWDGHEGFDSLGCCSFLPGTHEPVKKQVEQCVDDHQMREQALADLQRAVDRHDREQSGKLVLEAMGAVPEKTLKSWVARGFQTVVPLAKAELKRRAIPG